MRPYAFGVDVGGTAIKLGFFQTDGTLVKKFQIPTRTEENGIYILPDILHAMLTTMVEQQITWDDVEGVGMGVPGPVTEDGTVLRCINLGWDVFSIPEKLRELEPRIFKIRVTNDVNAATLGEMWQGGGKGYRNLFMITLGTGIGGGVILNGQMIYGKGGAAGEIGHICVNTEETEPCKCGHCGCLEQYCSATGLLRTAKRRLEERPKEQTLLRGHKNLTAKQVCDDAKKGDAVALELLDELGSRLGLALNAVAGTLDPEIFVIGGGLSNAGDILLQPIVTHYRRHAFHAYNDTTFALAKLGNDAGIYGCVNMVLS